MRQEHLTGRIRKVYGDAVDTTITDWACAHGDIGWANVTAPTLTLLDWESWGRAAPPSATTPPACGPHPCPSPRSPPASSPSSTASSTPGPATCPS
ncbi:MULTISPECIES: hypothetical protein [unclassified Streptomyces]|uniref:hypothetical protein n=1 Tax=unclassified Streptomyces TaxID=2593676 RepID=UPI001BEA91FE|nr:MULTISPECIES: hypothetical protein [unclassified Streptomyces]MBT2408137.1 hypothetical protein [Streptomyces sp. ISL-21]MBT2609304.1 hypothetical protein [Streptomyces sp. ISL-87]